MAMLVEIFKIKEDRDFVYYKYQFIVFIARKNVKDVDGELRLNKKDGTVDIMRLAPEDKGRYVMRAISILTKHWQKGEYPDKTCWAS